MSNGSLEKCADLLANIVRYQGSKSSYRKRSLSARKSKTLEDVHKRHKKNSRSLRSSSLPASARSSRFTSPSAKSESLEIHLCSRGERCLPDELRTALHHSHEKLFYRKHRARHKSKLFHKMKNELIQNTIPSEQLEMTNTNCNNSSMIKQSEENLQNFVQMKNTFPDTSSSDIDHLNDDDAMKANINENARDTDDVDDQIISIQQQSLDSIRESYLSASKTMDSIRLLMQNLQRFVQRPSIDARIKKICNQIERHLNEIPNWNSQLSLFDSSVRSLYEDHILLRRRLRTIMGSSGSAAYSPTPSISQSRPSYQERPSDLEQKAPEPTRDSGYSRKQLHEADIVNQQIADASVLNSTSQQHHQHSLTTSEIRRSLDACRKELQVLRMENSRLLKLQSPSSPTAPTSTSLSPFASAADTVPPSDKFSRLSPEDLIDFYHDANTTDRTSPLITTTSETTSSSFNISTTDNSTQWPPSYSTHLSVAGGGRASNLSDLLSDFSQKVAEKCYTVEEGSHTYSPALFASSHSLPPSRTNATTAPNAYSPSSSDPCDFPNYSLSQLPSGSQPKSTSSTFHYKAPVPHATSGSSYLSSPTNYFKSPPTKFTPSQPPFSSAFLSHRDKGTDGKDDEANESRFSINAYFEKYTPIVSPPVKAQKSDFNYPLSQDISDDPCCCLSAKPQFTPTERSTKLTNGEVATNDRLSDIISGGRATSSPKSKMTGSSKLPIKKTFVNQGKDSNQLVNGEADHGKSQKDEKTAKPKIPHASRPSLSQKSRHPSSSDQNRPSSNTVRFCDRPAVSQPHDHSSIIDSDPSQLSNMSFPVSISPLSRDMLKRFESRKKQQAMMSSDKKDKMADMKDKSAVMSSMLDLTDNDIGSADFDNVSNVSSLKSYDDVKFREGLESLDNQIARLQFILNCNN